MNSDLFKEKVAERMEKDTMITLDDNTMYVLLDETEIDNKKYFFAVRVDNETKNPTTEFEIFEEEVEDGETYMTSLEEGPFKQAILIDFTNNYMYMIGEMMEQQEEE